MPIFELVGEDKTILGRATFHKKEDYMVVTLKGDPLKLPHLVHAIHGKKIIAKKLADEVKDAKVEEREIETVVTPIKK